MNKVFTNASLIAALVAVGGCQTIDQSWFTDPVSRQVEMAPRDEKRVQVAPSEMSFAVRFPPGRPGITDAERRAATGFLQRRATGTSDEIFVDFGVLHESTHLARDRRMTIAEIATAAGLDPARIKVRANVRGIAENEINLTVRRYLVTLPGCPDYTSRAGRTFDNRPHSNWGCANAVNFGMMVAEPSDILAGRGDTPGDAEALVLGIQRYRAGETKALEVDDTNTAETHGTTGESGSGGSQ